ncbi:hypothetical protein QCA50_011629 [Cerrena zonata]|uniref:DUF4100 domain-containing protein n=1 Tax=Cerrena zonata TaxID=2478898 RepID=A0AAW0FWI3_9APHY
MTAINQTGVHHLPVPGTKSAPKKFKGKFSQVKLFIKHYEKLCAQKLVTDEEEKIQNITQYCSRSVREFMEGLPSYSGKNWEVFVQDLLEYFDAERYTKRYKRGDLEAYCKHMRHKKSTMRMPHWKSYNRKFIRIAGWLESHKKISEDEKDLYFWKGIPQDFRDKLEARLLAIYPDHDLENPFKTDSVCKVAKSLLQRNRFDNERTLSEDETDYDSDSESDDEEDEDNSDSDWDTDHESVKKHKSRLTSRDSKKVRFKPRLKEHKEVVKSEPKTTENKISEDKSKSKEVEDLIDQMNCLSIHDQSYSSLYYRAYSLDPMVADIMMKPVERQQIAQRVSSQAANRAASAASPGPPLSFNRSPPPHLKPGNNAFQQAPLNPEDRRCFGCGGTGHTMFFCSKISDLVTKGIITKDSTGKYIMADGTFIQRATFDEPLIAAIERLRPIQNHYISISPARVEDYESDSSDSEDEDSEENVFVATRSSAKNNQFRKTTSEKVFNPSRKKHEESHPRFGDKKKTDKKVQPEEILPVPTNPVPISVDDTIFNPQDDDALMEDTSETIKQKDLSVVAKRIPKQSEVQSQVDQRNVLSRILNQPVTLAIGEVFGISKEMTSNLREVLKPKPPSKLISNIPEIPKVNLGQVNQPIVAAAMVYRAKETLIKLKMECEGMPITAIIDTGSQLNIAHKNVWKEVLSRPLDTQSTVNMNDANGGASKLKGLVPNVPLICGGVKTFASLYIGEKVPFDLLLGRPWQRGNFVSIDERADGTYLIFKDQELNPRHEILVTPDEHLVEDPNIADFLQKARSNRFYAHSYFIEEEPEENTLIETTAFIEEIPIENTEEIPPIIPEEIPSIIPEKRSITMPENPRPSTRLRTDNLGHEEIELASKSENRQDDDLPPGLEWPTTSLGVERLNQLWSSTEGNVPNNKTCEEDLIQTRGTEESTVSDKQTFGPLKKLKLVQVLTKTSTSKWREKIKWKGDEPHHQRAVSKSKRKHSPAKLLVKAVENTRINRFWGLLKQLRSFDDNTSGSTHNISNDRHVPNNDENTQDSDDLPDISNQEIESSKGNKVEEQKARPEEQENESGRLSFEVDAVCVDTGKGKAAGPSQMSELINCGKKEAVTIRETSVGSEENVIDSLTTHRKEYQMDKVLGQQRPDEVIEPQDDQDVARYPLLAEKTLPDKLKTENQNTSEQEQVTSIDSSQDSEGVIEQVRQMLEEFSILEE